MKLRRKVMGLALTVCMMSSLLLPKLSVSAAGNGKAIQLVEDGSAANISGGQTSNIYFGTYQQRSAGSQQPSGTEGVDWMKSDTATKQNQGPYYNIDPIKWRVLSNEGKTQPDEGDKLFLLADQSLDVVRYNETRIPITWAESTMRSWLNGYDANENINSVDYSAADVDSFLGSAFSGTEKGAIPKTAIENKNNGNISGGAGTEDYIFLLSLDEVQNTTYGFSADTSANSIRIATNTDYVQGGGKTSGSMDSTGVDMWWLRSPTNKSSDFALVITRTGSVRAAGYEVNNGYRTIRPAFKLNLEQVLFTSDAEGGKVPDPSGSGSSSGAVGEIFEIANYTGNDWKMTMLDKDRQFAISDVQISGSTVSFSYSGAKTGTNEYISAVIMTNGELTHYGRVLELDGTVNGADGDNVSISIPSGMTLDADTELYLFNEQYNGGVNDDTKLTDYASALVKAKDTTAPALTAGEVTRMNDTSATVKFTSSEAGTYYYEVVDSGASEPIINTAGAGTACDTSEQTITLDNLTAGAKDIWIVAKDGVGNVSDPLKIEIPAYVPPSYGLSATPSALDFGTLTEDDTNAPEAQTVTVENTGNQSLTISLPASTSYVIAAGTGFEADGTAELDAGSTAQFTVQPKTGLSAGNYDETLTISGTDGTQMSAVQASVALSLHVQSGTDSDFRPVITEGADGVWTKGSTEALSFRSNAEYTDFLKVQVDGSDVAVTDYEVSYGSDGSTFVTLKVSYLETLSVGVHTLAVISQTGTAETTFTIRQGEGGGTGQDQETPSDPSEETPSDPSENTPPSDGGGDPPKTDDGIPQTGGEDSTAGDETVNTGDEAAKSESGTSLTDGGDSRIGSDTSNIRGKAPGTGDDSRAALWGMLALLAGVCSAQTLLVRRRKIK